MFGTRAAMKQYLALIAPWAGNSWSEDDVNTPEFATEKTNESWIQFTIPSRPLPGFIEQMFLGRVRTQNLVNVIGCVNRFNNACSMYNALPRTSPHRLVIAKVMHRTIGTLEDNLLHAAFLMAKAVA